MQIVQKYFPDLSEKQIKQFTDLKELYEHWNSQINVISRKNMDVLYINHILQGGSHKGPPPPQKNAHISGFGFTINL